MVSGRRAPTESERTVNLVALRITLRNAEKANVAAHNALAAGTGSLDAAFAAEKALKAAARALAKASK